MVIFRPRTASIGLVTCGVDFPNFALTFPMSPKPEDNGKKRKMRVYGMLANPHQSLL